ncbi:MAG: ABC transporter ATP-binding protein [Cyclobacteriaceae bacterium]|nr:ABC transporter ATP-binding protein [Cyclobacteriaceae bacterium]MCH8516669.1 ABC transporter ATP-binding protein [Cyclobacteriaceae bacterium]
MLEVNELAKSFGKVVAVNDLSFSLCEGDVVGIVGPNGAGKSTTFKLIIGLLRKTKGDIKIGGYDHQSMEAKRLFAYIPETPNVYDLLSVEEHLTFIAQAYSLENYEDYAEELLQKYELADKKKKLGRELSKGMRQKVSICCGLLIRPKLLFLDEPFIGLDPKAIRVTKEIFQELKAEGTTILVSTHIIDSLESVIDRVIILKAGQMIMNETIAAVRDQYVGSESESLEDYFLKITADE